MRVQLLALHGHRLYLRAHYDPADMYGHLRRDIVVRLPADGDEQTTRSAIHHAVLCLVERGRRPTTSDLLGTYFFGYGADEVWQGRLGEPLRRRR